MQLTSAVFKNGEIIPRFYSGEGADISPPLRWSAVPARCRELILICEDPDAPHRPEKDHPFVHWTVFNIDPSTTSLPEGIPPLSKVHVPVQIHQGWNSSGKIGYMGPMPPQGHGVHRYIFTLYALDITLGLKEGATKNQIVTAMKGHILEEAHLIGTFERKRFLEASTFSASI